MKNKKTFLEWIKENYGGSAITPSMADDTEVEKNLGGIPTYEIPKKNLKSIKKKILKNNFKEK